MGDKDMLATAAAQLAVAETKLAAAEQKLLSETARADSAEGRIASLEAEVKALRTDRVDADTVAEKDAEIKKQKQRADDAERTLAALPERIKDGTKKRVQLEKAAAEVLGDVDKNGKRARFDDLTDRELMCLVVEKLHGVQIDEDRSDDYARARFDAAVESFRAGAAALDKIREVAPKMDKGNRTDVAAMRDDHNQKTRDAWKQPLPSTSKFKKGA